MDKELEKYKGDIEFIEQYLNVEFEGSTIEDAREFIAAYMEDAENMYREIYSEYSAWMWWE